MRTSVPLWKAQATSLLFEVRHGFTDAAIGRGPPEKENMLNIVDSYDFHIS